ncbi:HEAT repeat domain-containing protein [Xylanivirga thermophila]|uniref:HEAT repeat domain-containing protein n=1 Tax=Xylanivirga thermophila TaxID=2496273 RepID=UPI00101D5479|nr:HEAT repeat domain-containing protein [Xylanivirga thermophila]
MFGVSVEKIDKWTKKGKVERLIKAASDSDKDIRLAAIRGLGKVDHEKSFNSLVFILRDEDPEIRGTACESLGELRKVIAEEHLKYIAKNDPDKKVKEKAIEAIKKIDEVNEEAL